jgi:hypothetical protein
MRPTDCERLDDELLVPFGKILDQTRGRARFLAREREQQRAFQARLEALEISACERRPARVFLTTRR